MQEKNHSPFSMVTFWNGLNYADIYNEKSHALDKIMS